MTRMAEQLAASPMGRKSQLDMATIDCLKRTTTVANAGRMLADVFERQNPWARELIGRENIERFTFAYALRWSRDMLNKAQSDSAPKLVEERGQPKHVKNGQTTWTPRDIPAQGAEQDRGGTGQSTNADNGLEAIAPPVREPDAKSVKNDGEEGHHMSARNGQDAYASSPSPEITGGGQPASASNGPVDAAPSCEPKTTGMGHNKGSKLVERTAFDPDLVAAAQSGIKLIIAQSISETWKFSDGRLVCKVPLYEHARREDDGDIGAIIRAMVAQRYASVDMTKTPEELLSEDELKECFESARANKLARKAA